MGMMTNFRLWMVEKLNPAQPEIARDAGDIVNNQNLTITYEKAYEELDIVRRGVDMIVNGCASFEISVKDQIKGVLPISVGMRKSRLNLILNHEPNPFQNINAFRRSLYMDLILEGNCFIHTSTENELFHLPAKNVEILTDPKTFVSGYKYNSKTFFKPSEIIHIQDNAGQSIYRGEPRLKSAEQSIKTLRRMINFQDNFFENGAVPGLVLTSPNVLGEKTKERMIYTWMTKYNPRIGGRRPLILDGGLDVKSYADTNFRELDFDVSIGTKEKAILKALGVPPILLDGGNNANIAPNLKLFYLETVMPLVQAVTAGFERHFGYDLEAETGKISALQPQMSEAASFYATLVNSGLITPNEAREELRYERIEGQDELREPQNITGSATNPSQGGKPPKTPKE